MLRRDFRTAQQSCMCKSTKKLLHALWYPLFQMQISSGQLDLDTMTAPLCAGEEVAHSKPTPTQTDNGRVRCTFRHNSLQMHCSLALPQSSQSVMPRRQKSGRLCQQDCCWFLCRTAMQPPSPYCTACMQRPPVHRAAHREVSPFPLAPSQLDETSRLSTIATTHLSSQTPTSMHHGMNTPAAPT